MKKGLIIFFIIVFAGATFYFSDNKEQYTYYDQYTLDDLIELQLNYPYIESDGILRYTATLTQPNDVSNPIVVEGLYNDIEIFDSFTLQGLLFRNLGKQEGFTWDEQILFYNEPNDIQITIQVTDVVSVKRDSNDILTYPFTINFYQYDLTLNEVFEDNNLVVNGNFENGITPWVNDSYGLLEVENGKGKITFRTTDLASLFSQTINYNINENDYLYHRFSFTLSDLNADRMTFTHYAPFSSNFYRNFKIYQIDFNEKQRSEIYQSNISQSSHRLWYRLWRDDNLTDTIMYLDNVYLIPLTSLGIDNLTKEQMDEYYELYQNIKNGELLIQESLGTIDVTNNYGTLESPIYRDYLSNINYDEYKYMTLGNRILNGYQNMVTYLNETASDNGLISILNWVSNAGISIFELLGDGVSFIVDALTWYVDWLKDFWVTIGDFFADLNPF